MTSPAFVTEADVRGYLNVTDSTENYSSGNLGSNIRAASSFLQRTTGRQFVPQAATTKKFSTNGDPYLSIPDLRTLTSITLQGTALVEDSTFWKVYDRNNTGVIIGIQLRPFGTNSYRSNPEWFDRNLDQPWFRYGWGGSLPNDLAIAGDWGHDPYPDELLHATKVLAGWMTLRPDSLLANVRVTPDGAILNFGDLPPEVVTFITEWRQPGPMAVAVG